MDLGLAEALRLQPGDIAATIKMAATSASFALFRTITFPLMRSVQNTNLTHVRLTLLHRYRCRRGRSRLVFIRQQVSERASDVAHRFFRSRRERQMRKQQVRYAVRFFKMRITGENESFNSQVGVFLHSFRDRGWIANQRCASASAHQAHTRPEIGAYFQFFATAAMQLRHPTLAFGVEPCEGCLRSGDRV